MIRHHLPDELLLGYSTGTLSEAEALLVACHLTLCDVCRRRLDWIDGVKEAAVSIEPVDVDIDALLAGTLGRLDAAPPAPVVDPDGILPAPLAAMFGSFSSLPWSSAVPGIAQIELELSSIGAPAKLFKLQPGSRVPDHKHPGTELSLVFTGGFSDESGHYIRGDVSVRGPQTVHQQRIDLGEPCVVLVLNEGPLIPTTALGWLVSRLGQF